ncbi:MAG: hypothetical protein VX740_10750 [Pseudomonadota bacterium]|nr:hypothetical protein [Pseudomonadota bacterium]MED5423906.1 hypothetical protein [Pseudomonadota bacterium]MEE3322926.1 hypothetical protein [Pseudomonadota bacterium]
MFRFMNTAQTNTAGTDNNSGLGLGCTHKSSAAKKTLGSDA